MHAQQYLEKEHGFLLHGWHRYSSSLQPHVLYFILQQKITKKYQHRDATIIMIANFKNKTKF
jgi:hypothetical protein